MKSSVSIIIPTYKRKESVLRLLKSLVREKVKPLEVVIVEQAENNKDSYSKIARKYQISLRYFFLSNPSTPKAMNTGVKVANGKFILFLDDDVVVQNEILQAHINNFRDPMVAATVGRSITRGQRVQRNRKDTGRITWLGHFTDGFSSKIRQYVDTVIGCNSCWRKDIYIALGGIDEQFTGNAMRLESDFSLRAKQRGYKIIFEPSALVKHYRAETGGARKTEGRLQWYFDFFSNEVYFFLKHRFWLILPIFLLTKTEWAIRCMFGFGREVSIRSIITPFAGVLNGIGKYRVYLHTYENRS